MTRYTITVEGTFRAAYVVEANSSAEALGAFEAGETGDAVLWEVIDSDVTDIAGEVRGCGRRMPRPEVTP